MQKKRLFTRLNTLVVMLVFTSILSVSCGKKGPLYMPKSNPQDTAKQIDIEQVEKEAKKTRKPY